MFKNDDHNIQKSNKIIINNKNYYRITEIENSKKSLENEIKYLNEYYTKLKEDNAELLKDENNKQLYLNNKEINDNIIQLVTLIQNTFDFCNNNKKNAL